jgi:hypothetical protein
VVAAPPPDVDAEPRERRWRWTPGRVLVTIAIVGMVAMWGYVLYLAFGPGRADPIDRLDDPAFGRAAEARCAQARDALDELPLPQDAATPAERADTVEAANVELAPRCSTISRPTFRPAPTGGTSARGWPTGASTSAIAPTTRMPCATTPMRDSSSR